MVLRKLDTSRSYGEMCPPGPGGFFTQDNLRFNSQGVEIPEGMSFPGPDDDIPFLGGAKIEALLEPDIPADILAMDRVALTTHLRNAGVKVDLRKSDVTLREELAAIRKKG